MSDTLARLRRHAEGTEAMAPDAPSDARATLDDALELARWQAIERAMAPHAGTET
jgi:hypothetical protein